MIPFYKILLIHYLCLNVSMVEERRTTRNKGDTMDGLESNILIFTLKILRNDVNSPQYLCTAKEMQ